MKVLPKVYCHGFTLVEILIAISIISVVFGVILTSAAGIQKSGRDTQRKADLASLKSALQQYYADQIFYPDDGTATGLNISSLASLTNSFGNPVTPTTSQTYSKSIPSDPKPGTTTPYCYKAYTSYENSTAPFPADCNNGADKCFYYSLVANLENAPSNPANVTCGGQPYNYQVTPLSETSK